MLGRSIWVVSREGSPTKTDVVSSPARRSWSAPCCSAPRGAFDPMARSLTC